MKTVKELQDMLQRGEIKVHHSAYAMGYMSRKSKGEVEEYNGRFGKGYKVHLPLWSSTRFHKVVYVVF